MVNDGWTYGGSSDDPTDMKVCMRATFQDPVASDVCLDVLCWNQTTLSILGLTLEQFRQHVLAKTIDAYLGSLNTDRIFKCKVIVQPKETGGIWQATAIFAKCAY